MAATILRFVIFATLLRCSLPLYAGEPPPPVSAETLTIKHLSATKNKSKRLLRYESDLLETMREYAPKGQGIELEIERYHTTMSRSRQAIEIEIGNRINICINSGSASEFHKSNFIAIPILKGLLGFRQLVVHADNPLSLNKITNINELRKFRVGQPNQWLDSKIYQANDINVVSGFALHAAFNMLARSRFDGFPLGLIEAEKMLAEQNNAKLLRDDDLLLYYPWPFFIWVSSKQPKLTTFITNTLDQMTKDNRLDELIQKHFESEVAVINSDNTRIIWLNNPYLPSSIPTDRSELWYIIPEPQDKPQESAPKTNP
ncbi:MAG: hypothetical protein COA42_13460 [Alteromonadaceae bacterium]|nr:MAG: hypothetical protein COA42_13460 [Alteromonadaceae bacterium]